MAAFAVYAPASASRSKNQKESKVGKNVPMAMWLVAERAAGRTF
jgi:hypothetical protein